MRRSARSPASETAITNQDFRLIASQPHIVWVFYHGYVSQSELATGYSPDQHESWCIPRSLWKQRESMNAEQYFYRCMNDARKLRILDDGVIKINYTDPTNEKWWVLAPPPDARPIYGVVIRAQPVDRSGLAVVPVRTATTGGTHQERVRQLQANRGVQGGQPYPEVDEVWIATVRVKANGRVEVFGKGDSQPLLKLYRELANIKSRSTKFDHDPDQLSFASHQVSPASKDLPSTNTVPVQTFIQFNGDFLMIASMAIAAAKYVKNAGRKGDLTTHSFDKEIVPTKYIDYEDLKREKA